MQSTDWTREQSKALREYLAEGMSYSAIAKAINATFKTDFSRNAALSRATRMGIAGTGSAGRPMPPPPVTPAPRRRVDERGAAGMLWFPPAFKSKEMPKLRCADVAARHLSLMELKRGDCRYPYGGDKEGEAITFCGHRRRPGSSYCAAHFDLTVGPGTASERDADRILLKFAASHVRVPIKSESIVPELADFFAGSTV